MQNLITAVTIKTFYSVTHIYRAEKWQHGVSNGVHCSLSDIIKLGDKKPVYEMELVRDENLIVSISGEKGSLFGYDTGITFFFSPMLQILLSHLPFFIFYLWIFHFNMHNCVFSLALCSNLVFSPLLLYFLMKKKQFWSQ